jgi:hypothetical protein
MMHNRQANAAGSMMPLYPHSSKGFAGELLLSAPPLPASAGGVAQGGRVPVVFELGKHCSFGNSFAIIGEAPGLGAWDPQHAAKMEVGGTRH